MSEYFKKYLRKINFEKNLKKLNKKLKNKNYSSLYYFYGKDIYFVPEPSDKSILKCIEYLDKFEASKNGEDLFGSVGTNTNHVSSTSKDICNKPNVNEGIDLSWLDSI